MIVDEATRRRIASLFQWFGWWGSLSLGLWAVHHFDPSEGHFAPQWVGLGYIFLVGVAIAASNARSRMKLSDTISQAFSAGMDAHEQIVRERTGRIIDELHEVAKHTNGTLPDERPKPEDAKT